MKPSFTIREAARLVGLKPRTINAFLRPGIEGIEIYSDGTLPMESIREILRRLEALHSMDKLTVEEPYLWAKHRPAGFPRQLWTRFSNAACNQGKKNLLEVLTLPHLEVLKWKGIGRRAMKALEEAYPGWIPKGTYSREKGVCIHCGLPFHGKVHTEDSIDGMPMKWWEVH